MALKIERATMAECRFVYDLAVEPSVRHMSTRPDTFSFDQHERWYVERLSDPATLLLTGSDGHDLIGYVRYQRDGSTAEVSIAVAPQHRGRGHGLELLRAGDERAFAALGVEVIRALVLPENAASQHVFAQAGYERAGSEERSGRPHLRYEKRAW